MSLISGFGDRSELEICLCGEQVAASLLELLVDFRSLDNGEELALLNARSDVDVPLFQISVSTGINGRGDEWLYISRKDDLLGRRGLLRRNNRYGGERPFRPFRLQPFASPPARTSSKKLKGGKHHPNTHKEQPHLSKD